MAKSKVIPKKPKMPNKSALRAGSVAASLPKGRKMELAMMSKATKKK